MSKILVTGGAGFIGSHLTDELIKLGHTVVVLDDLSGGFEENVNPKAKLVVGSITDVNLIKKLFSQNQFDYIFHLAAYAAEGLSQFIKNFNYQNNLIGSVNLINAAVNYQIKCFVFTSSIAVYGSGQVPMTEAMIPQPEDSYGIAKYAVELDLKISQELFGLNYIIFRPHNVFGEKQNLGDKYRNVIGIFMNQIMQDLPLTIFGDGQQKRAFSYISDIAQAMAGSVFNSRAYNQIFNIGGDEVITINELANLVFSAMGKKTEIIYLPPRHEVKIAYANHQKVKDVLDYRPAINIAEGLKRMAKWAKQAGVKKSKKFELIEITKNLPPSWLE